jgi:nucleoid DNA-binding protein
MSKITKKDLVDFLKTKFSDHDFDQDFLIHFVDDLFDTISYEIVVEQSVMISKFGKFIIKEYGNSNKKIGFLPSRSLKKTINSKQS